MIPARPKVIGIGLLLAALLGAQLWTTVYFINSDRAHYTDQFIAHSRSQLETAVGRVEEELDDTLNIFEVLGELMATGDLEQARQELRAAVRHQSALSTAALWGAEGERRLAVYAEAVSSAERTRHTDLLGEAYRQAVDAPMGFATAGAPSDSADRGLRAFVAAVDRPQPHATYIGVVIDIREAFDRLKALEGRAGTAFLIRGPEGEVEQTSSVSVPAAWTDGTDQPPAFFERMGDRRSGTDRIDPETAEQLGLPANERVVHFTSFEVEPGIAWSIASIHSLLPVRTESSWIVWRAGIVSAAFGVVLFGFGGLLVMAIRRQSDLQERLGQNQLINELNAKADAILDAIPVGVMVLDRHSHIQDANTEMTAWLGTDALGRPLEEAWEAATSSPFAPLADLVADEDDEARVRFPRRALLEDVEFDDERVDLQVEAVPLLASGTSTTMVLVFEDVTDLIEIDQPLLFTDPDAGPPRDESP